MADGRSADEVARRRPVHVGVVGRLLIALTALGVVIVLGVAVVPASAGGSDDGRDLPAAGDETLESLVESAMAAAPPRLTQAELDVHPTRDIGGGPMSFEEFERSVTRTSGPTVATDEGRLELMEQASAAEAEEFGSYGAPEDGYNAPLDQFVRGYAADEDVSLELARRRIHFQLSFGGFVSELRSRFPGQVFKSELSLEEQSGSVRLSGSVPDAEVDSLAREYGVDVRVFDDALVNQQEYREVVTYVLRTLRAAGIDAREVSMDPGTGELTVGVLGPLPRLSAAREALGYDDLRLEQLEEAPRVDVEADR